MDIADAKQNAITNYIRAIDAWQHPPVIKHDFKKACGGTPKRLPPNVNKPKNNKHY